MSGQHQPLNDPNRKPLAPVHLLVGWLDGFKPTGDGGGRGCMVREVGPVDEVEEEGHDSVAHLLDLAGVDVDEAEVEVIGKSGVDDVADGDLA